MDATPQRSRAVFSTEDFGLMKEAIGEYIKKIADEHGSRIDITNRVEDGKILGAQVSLSFEAETSHQLTL